MQQADLSVPKKRLIGALGIGMIIVIILLTFLSKTINNLLLPKVTTVQFVTGSLQESFEAEGSIELMEKSRVVSVGSWKVEEVAVKADQQVKKGDLLAVMNERDVGIDLKTFDYEIIKLENDLHSYKESYKPIRLSDYERELQLAQKEINVAKNHLDVTNEMYELGIETKKSLEEAQDDYTNKLYQHQSKKELLEDKKRESQFAQAEFNRTVKEKAAELDLKKMIYKKKSENITEDGRLVSDMDGLITAVNIHPGMSTSINQTMFEIAEISSPYRVTWFLNAEKAISFVVGDEVNIKITGEVIEEDKAVLKTEYVKAIIAGKEFIADSDSYKYWADIPMDEYGIEVKVKEGQKAEVQAVKGSETYDYLLPKSGVTQIQGKYYIYQVKERQGALGEEEYVVQIGVDILDENDFYVATSGYFRNDDRVVVNTTKPLSDGMKVYVR